MAFTSLTHLSLFLPLALVLSAAVRGRKAGRVLQLVLGLAFLLGSGWRQALFFLAFLLINYALTFCGGSLRKALAVLLNILAILLVKLLPFMPGGLLGLILPLGISYAALQALSYHLDGASGSLWDFAFYLLFFPKLPMGPLAAFSDLASQAPDRSACVDDLYAGLQRLIVGLVKKLLLADRLAGIALAVQTAAPQDRGSALMVLAALVFPLQLYLDFSGYTDIALGTARAMGYRLPENFRQPFRADSLRDFWRRWHQSLTGWLGRYVYLPLGGSRMGMWRTVFNTAVVFLLIALWHGIGWGFLLWGAWNALIITLERAGALRPQRLPGVMRRLYVYLTAAAGFVFFTISGNPVQALRAFFIRGNPALALAQLNPLTLLALLAGIALCALEGRGCLRKTPLPAAGLALMALLLVSLLASAAGGYLPFLYAGF